MTSRIALLIPEGGHDSAMLIPSTSVLFAAVESYSESFVFAIFYPCLNHVFDSGVSSTHISLPVADSVQVSEPTALSVHNSLPTVESDHVSVPTSLSDHSSPKTVPSATIVPLELIIASPLNVAFAKHSANASELIMPVPELINPP